MKKLLIAVTACATLALAGCGDDGDSGSEELSKDEFIAQADEICEKSSDRIDEAEDGFADPNAPTEEEIDAAMDDVVVPELREQLEGIRDLDAPDEDDEQIEEMLDNLEKGIDSLEEDWQAPDNEAFAKASEIAVEYGFEECGEE
jgi:hypothetical protein